MNIPDNDRKLFKKLESATRLLYMIRDLGIKSAHKPAVAAWTASMSVLSDKIASKAW